MNVLILLSHLLLYSNDYYFPHFTFKANQWQTEISLFNPTLVEQEVVIKAFDSHGMLSAENILVLPPEGGTFGKVDELFMKLEVDRGWLLISSDSDQLEGTLQFTESQSGGSSTLPLSKKTSQFLSIPKVVHSQAWQSGFSLVNTSESSAEVSIQLVDFNGNIRASEEIEMKPLAKYVGMVSSLFPDVELPVNSILKFRSDQPILALGLAFSSGNQQIVALPAVETRLGSNHQELAQKLQLAIEEMVEEIDLIHSMSLGVTNSQEDFEFHLSAGLADPYNLAPQSPDHAFRLASVSKTFTAVAILQMVEQGYLSLHDLVVNHLPSELIQGLHLFGGQDFGSHMTVRQLLNHTSGMGDHFFDGDNNGNGTPDLLEIIFTQQDTFWTPEALIEYHKVHIDSLFAPGEGYHYSDMNYVLLGLILEALAGKPLHKVLRESIFDPLEMNDTWLEYRETPTATLSHCFLEHLDYTNYQSVSADWAGGGLASTTRDLTIFMKALIHGTLFENSNTFLQMLDFGPTDQPGYYYGLGIYLQETELGTFFGHTGFSGAFMFYWAERDFVLTGTTNQAALDEFNIFQELVHIISGSTPQQESLQIPVEKVAYK